MHSVFIPSNVKFALVLHFFSRKPSKTSAAFAKSHKNFRYLQKQHRLARRVVALGVQIQDRSISKANSAVHIRTETGCIEAVLDSLSPWIDPV